MSIADCIELPQPPTPPSLEIPQFGILETARQSLHDLPDISTYIMSMQNAAALALAPLRRFLELIEVVLTIKECFSVIPDSLLPPDPTAIIDCIKNLAKAIARLAAFFPPLSYIPTILDLANFVIQIVDEIISLFELLDQRLTQYTAVLNSATELGDLELAAVANCGSAEANIQILNAMEILKFVTPIINSILTPIARIVPEHNLRQVLEDIADVPAQLDLVETDIQSTVGPPVLEPLIQLMVILRNAAVMLYNTAAPIIGREANKGPRDIPEFQNF